MIKFPIGYLLLVDTVTNIILEISCETNIWHKRLFFEREFYLENGCFSLPSQAKNPGMVCMFVWFMAKDK